jgi:hypothetical protein
MCLFFVSLGIRNFREWCDFVNLDGQFSTISEAIHHSWNQLSLWMEWIGLDWIEMD